MIRTNDSSEITGGGKKEDAQKEHGHRFLEVGGIRFLHGVNFVKLNRIIELTV